MLPLPSLRKNFSVEKVLLTSTSISIISICINQIMVSNVVEAVKIDKIYVPDVVQSGNSSEAILDCIYSGVSDNFTVQWLFKDREPPVYEWTPLTEPHVRGIMDGKIDLSYRPSAALTEERRALRIVMLEPEMSGDYSCRIIDQATEVRQTKTMLVFSPEKEFAVEFDRKGNEIDIKCIARGVYPQPEVILECNGVIFAKQQVRVWRSEGSLYDTENTALLSDTSASRDRPKQITCRLQIPPAGYTAIKKELLCVAHECGNRSSKVNSMFQLPLVCLGIKAVFMLNTT